MSHSKLFAGLFATWMALNAATLCNASKIYPVNDGFETPDLGAGGYGYGDTKPYGINVPTFTATPGTGWTFTGTAGIASNGSAFGVTGATNLNQNGGAMSTSGQAGFIQNGYGDPNTISEFVSGLPGGPTSVTFSLESRGGNNASVDVTLNGVDLGTYQPLSGGSFNTVTTPSILLGSGSFDLVFTGVSTTGTDNTAFIDNISVNVVPEPSPLVALVGLGAVGLFVAVRRRRMT